MSEHNITVEGGSSVRLKTAGKYCDRDIVVISTGGAEDLDSALTEQETLIDVLKEVLREKTSGGDSADNGVLPIGYTPVPSIKFTGEQAVDTGIICNQNTQLRVVFTVDEEKNMYVYGVSNADNTASLTAYRTPTGGRWRFGNRFIALTTTPDEKIVWGAQVNKERILRSNVLSTFSNVNDFTTEGTLVLGGCRTANGNIEETTFFVGKIVAFELYDGDELVLHFVPCKNADGVCGFWDNISEQFFTTISDTPLQWSFI